MRRGLMPGKVEIEGAARAIGEIQNEYAAASNRYPPFNSAHEGYAVIWEEMDELKTEVWKSPKKREPEKMRAEAIQVAAMALRFLVDCC